MKIAVIVPFYQRDPGILPKAVNAVLAQDLPAGTNLWVIIVDDSSPVPAEGEIAYLSALDRSRMTLLTQTNGGPGDARNRALDLVADRGADYVAFLDSDDVWKPNHLRDALEALEAGFDFYFCDHTRFDDQATYASSVPALAELQDSATPGYRMLDSDGPVITVDGSAALSAYLREYLSQTSTVVVRQSCVHSLRFDAEQRGAGEDQLYWINLVAAGARMAISWRVNVHCGRGVNIYFEAFDFGSVKAVDRIGYVFLFWHKCSLLPGTELDHGQSASKSKRYLRAYSYMFLRALLRGQLPDLRLFRSIWKRVPLMPITMPFRFLSVLPHRREESKLW